VNRAAEPIVEFKNVQMRFGAHQVHRDMSFQVYPGEVLTLLGPSGTGKSVLLKLLIGLLIPTGGEIIVFGKNMSALDEDGLLETRRKIGMLFQGAALFDSMNVYDNVAYGLHEAHILPEPEIKRIVEEKLALVNLPGTEKKYPPQLSGGQKKRVGLARALASSPQIVLFDEPTTGLDPTSVRLIDALIVQLREELKITSIVVTHDIESAKRVSDRWLLMNEGRVIAEGEVPEIIQQSEDVRGFIEGRWE
jgi:phospholipid/cholesterol/gamma-HCH transport system ATP-binding protein